MTEATSSIAEAPQGAAIIASQPLQPGDPLRLSSSTIRTAAALQIELVARLDENGAVCIDGSAVERVDTATLQLLAAFVRDLRADSRPVEWSGCSAILQRAANSLGLGPALGLVVDKT